MSLEEAAMRPEMPRREGRVAHGGHSVTVFGAWAEIGTGREQ